MSERKTDRRRFLKGAVGVVGIGAASALVGCATTPPATPTTAPVATTAPAPTTAAQPTTAAGATPGAAAKATAPATLKYADKAVVHRYMTGGFTTAGPDDKDIKALQEEALKKQYGLNVDIQFESATWADIDPLMELRLQTQATDSLQRHHRSVLRWVSTPGLVRNIDQEMKEYGKNLLQLLPAGSYEFFFREDKKYTAVPSLRIAVQDVDYRFIRRDWLKKVNRDIPTSIEEIDEVLRLFQSQKLGGNVTIPFVVESPNWYLSVFDGLWSLEPAAQIDAINNGKPVGYISQFNEERLTILQKWYKDGLLNREWATWKTDDVWSAMTKNMIGCFSGQWGQLNGTIKTRILPASPESQDWVQIFPPVGLKGKPDTGRIWPGGPIERAIVVTSWAPAPEAIIALADWENSSWENFTLSRRGIEGKHWKAEANGAITDLRKQGDQREYSGMRATAWVPKWQSKNMNLPTPPNDPPIDPNITPRVTKNLHTRAVAHVPEQGEYPALGQVDRYTPYMYTKSQSRQGDMDSTANEYFAKIVNGDLPPSAAKDFFTKWMAAGGDIQVKETSDQFSAWIKDHPEWKDPKASFAPEYWDKTAKYPDPPKPKS